MKKIFWGLLGLLVAGIVCWLFLKPHDFRFPIQGTDLEKCSLGQDGAWGIERRDGTVVIPREYTGVYDARASRGYLVMFQSSGAILFDTNGVELCRADKFCTTNLERYWKYEKNGKCGIWSPRTRFETDYDDIHVINANGIFFVAEKESCLGALNYKGENIIPVSNKELYAVINGNEMFFVAGNGNGNFTKYSSQGKTIGTVSAKQVKAWKDKGTKFGYVITAKPKPQPKPQKK